jgi:hypothetical protein
MTPQEAAKLGYSVLMGVNYNGPGYRWFFALTDTLPRGTGYPTKTKALAALESEIKQRTEAENAAGRSDNPHLETKPKPRYYEPPSTPGYDRGDDR